jgi:PAS domain S-box-containing protein
MRPEERLRSSLKEIGDLKTALDEHAIVAITDPQGRITYVNDKFCAISKYSREELLGQDHRIINSGYHSKEFIRELWTTIAQGNVWKGEIKNRAKDGSYYWVDTTIVPFLNDDGKPRQYVAIRADITERKWTEEQLETSLKEIGDLKAALDEHAIVAITDPQGKITYVNDKFCAISKFPKEELLGQDHRIINSGYHTKEFIRDLWRTVSRGQVWHGEIKNKAKDNTFYWVDTTIVPFLNEQGKPRHYVAIRADITERKHAEERIQQLNTELEQRVANRTAELKLANQELESFSYSISHDLRAPLRAMGGFANILGKKFSDQMPPEAHLALQRIRDNAARMGQLIDGLLNFASLGRQSLEKKKIHPTVVARAAMDELHSELAGRNVEIEIADLPACAADRMLVQQVFANLLSNAIKYTRGRDPAIIKVGSRRENDECVYFVQDNGAGFDMEYSAKLFRVFQRLHSTEEFDGTGVGLAIVQRIVSRHGGRIWAEAAVDRGATFSFTLEEPHG